MRVVVLGAGGVGGYYGGLLARAGHEVGFLARGESLNALRTRGLEVRLPSGESFRPPVRAGADAAELGPADLALVAVKSYSLSEIGPAARALADGGADVLPLLNGVEAVPRLRGLGVRDEALLAGVTYISAAKVAPGVVERRSPFQRVVVGEPGGGRSERAEGVAAAFSDAGVDARSSGSMDVELWRKMIFLSSLAAVCGMSRAPVGPVRDAPLGARLLERAVGEAGAVARATGAALPEDEEENALTLLQSLPGVMLPSFVLDLESGGPTELDILSGAVSRMGRELGVDTPVHDTATAVLSAAVGTTEG